MGGPGPLRLVETRRQPVVRYDQVRRWRPEPLDEIEAQLKKCHDQLLWLADELHAAGAAPGWTGIAADAAADDLRPESASIRMK